MTKIEWTHIPGFKGETANPIRARRRDTGRIGWHCEHVSDGRRNCYAETMNAWRGTGLPYKPGHRKDVDIFVDDKQLQKVLRWKKPRAIFWCSMTDLFAPFVTDAMRDRIFATMALTPQHVHIVLTKHAAAMRSYFCDTGTPHRLARVCVDLWTDGTVNAVALQIANRWPVKSLGSNDDPSEITLLNWPLPTLRLGVTAEDQARADERVPQLLATPAAMRFASHEPALGPVDWAPYLYIYTHDDDAALACENDHVLPFRDPRTTKPEDITTPRLDQVIAGGESGPKARPMHPDWARQDRDQCAAAGVPFFFKQWGDWAPCRTKPAGAPGKYALALKRECGCYLSTTSITKIECYPRQFDLLGGTTVLEQVGKARAGRRLDGVEHNGFPEGAA